MRNLFRYITTVVIITGMLIPLWFLVANLQPIHPALYTFSIFLFIGSYVAIKVLRGDILISIKRDLQKLTKRKNLTGVAIIGITIFGLFARLFFYYRFSYVPTSDPMTFYDSAKTLAEGGSIAGNSYVAFQPYLSAYNNVLGLAMRLIPDPWLATILLNTFFDLLSGLVVYIFLKKILKTGSYLPLLGYAIWVLSPLNIIFSVLSLPVIVVNFFIILTFLVSYLLIKLVTKQNTWHSLLLSLFLGVIIGLGNCFRPIFIVTLLALAIVFMGIYLNGNKSAKFLSLSIGCTLLSLSVFIIIQSLNLKFVSHQTGLQAAKNPSGWSMYVGSGWESSGEWRPYNNDNMQKICEKSLAQKKYDDCHTKLRKAATENYKNYGVFDSTSLFIRKLYHQSEEQTYFYNAEHSILGYTESRTFEIIKIYSALFIFTLYIFCAKFLYSLSNKSASGEFIKPIFIFMVLVMLGWFFAMMLVESAPRYSTILYPIFIIFSVLAFDKKYAK